MRNNSITAEFGGPLIKKCGVEIPQRAIGLVVERQSVAGVEHGDAGGKLIERAAMRVREPSERTAHGFNFGRIDADAGTARFGNEIEHVEGSLRAANGRAQPCGVGTAGEPRLRNAFCAA